jgi:chromosome segregation ATPase
VHRERDEALERLAALRSAQHEREQQHAEEIATARQHQAAAEHAAQATAEQLAAGAENGVGHAVSMAEIAAQLEAELEHKRAELMAERAASQERRERLTAATTDLETARRQLPEIRGQLEQARADAARIERSLIDKDRALEARDERIRTLQSELDQKLGALQKLSAMDLSLQGLDSKMSERLRRNDAPPEPQNTPALICLTSDAPRHYALAKRTMTIGRSSQCDIQILTHFVSREHARLTISPRGNVGIEDLGSTNGVFVNSVRIERQDLHHGDLVTVGETQFRFLETMAH